MFGYLTFLLATSNVFLGLKLYKPEWVNGLAVYYAIVFLIWAILEFLLNLSGPKYAHKVDKLPLIPSKTSQQYDYLLSMLSEGKTKENVRKLIPEILYVTLDNRVYDVTGLDHPGGSSILEEVYGRDIDRFFYGAYCLESSKMNAHLHSKKARDLLESMFIGEFEPNEGKMIVKKKENIDITSFVTD